MNHQRTKGENVKIQFSTDNAAFCEAGGEESDGARQAESARILRAIADKLEAGQESGPVMDANGNKVGTWTE